jgi:predicted metal-dependent hydrolase
MKIIRSWRKSISLQIKNGELVVKAPFLMFNSTIENFIKKHQGWIDKKLKLYKNNIKYKKSLNKIEIEKLKIKAKQYIPNRVSEIASKYNKKYNKIKITSAKTRWGSCSSNKNLNFSYRLMLTPKDIIDYVIIHELSHLKHMNHSKDFYLELESMMSDYKQKEKWLKQN